MDDPIKIIHKYKNNNKRIQYQIHIFLGDIVDDNCMKILRKIKDMDLYDSLISLDEKERNIMIKNYGEYWYEKFFNSYHINNTKETVPKISAKFKELKSVYGNEWVNNHFINYLKRIETMTYNYEYAVKEERERRMVKKIIQKQQLEVDENIDYTTRGKSKFALENIEMPINDSSPEKMESFFSRVSGNKKSRSKDKDWCNEESSQDSSSDSWSSSSASSDSSDSSDEINSDNDIYPSETDSSAEIYEINSSEEIVEISKNRQKGGEEEFAEVMPDFDEPTAEFDFENIEAEQKMSEFDAEIEKDLENVDILFSELDEIDKNIKLTTKEIKEAIGSESYDKLGRKIVEFDNSKDNSMFDENLKDVVSKNYITHQYIYKDDTIKNVRYKICCGFKNNSKFSENTYIIPSYQYLWSEYQYKGKIERIMLGQKWIVKNDILRLDVEPNNNLGVYEDLRGNLKNLRDNIKRQGKIKYEDDENNIIFDYDGFYTYNDIYLIDIYNELGIDYDPNFEELKNLIDVYIKIYFPKIRPDDIKNIIDFLNRSIDDSKKIVEKNKLKIVFDSFNGDLILENEIMHDIEYVKKKNYKEYIKIFQENFVTQSVIRTYLLDRYKKIDLFRIFDNFLLDDNYPFIQYQPIDGTPRYRYSEKYLMDHQKKEIIMKWFENSPYGISFKVKVKEKTGIKYYNINLSDTGRIDYKIQWKEDDMSSVDDIGQTYKYIKDLIKKINKENDRYNIKFNVPTDDDFRFAFINTIQKFELPNNFSINHNDLSEFSRYFFPYVALVIEPRKRQSKIKKNEKGEKSKFGTYLRYKRVSKYENKTKIEHRIIFFMRNYEYDDQSLANEISKEFNITEEQAFSEMEAVREKYPNIKKSRKILKKLENIPKYKPPGIGIDIQGKTRNKYKMRIAGARDRQQLERIIRFMNVLIYLYVETYLYKKPERQKMKDRLKRLTKIARRRNKVDEIVDYDSSVRTVKQMTSIDKKRLMYKAEEDQNQWTRNCQNSGDDKKRRPQQFLSVEELQKMGYVWKETLDGKEFGHYERKVMVDAEGRTDSNKKKKEVILRAVKLALDEGGENFVYYTCSPEENGKHMFVGFLNKSKNPFGEAMPCCFIKDQIFSKNKEKKNFFLKSIGLVTSEENINKITGDQLYILQDSNKIQEGRLAFLPKYLDIFMNFMMDNNREIKNHYLISTPSGYYFKYGTRQDEYKYLNAVSAAIDMTIDNIKRKMIARLEADKNLSVFNSLNNGDIRTQFGTIDAYISYIKHNEYLEYPLLNDLLCLPGVIKKKGMGIIIFQKKIRIIRKTLEREKIKESYYIVCQNHENISDYKDPEREIIFIIKEYKNYYPIIMVTKENEQTKEISLSKTFHYSNEPKNIVNHTFNYYEINCQSEFHLLIKDKSLGIFTAKEINQILLSIEKKEYQPKIQIIDARNKCTFLVTHGGYIIPVSPSGSIYNIPITYNINNYIKEFSTTMSYLKELMKLTRSQLKIKPIGIFYKEKKGKKYIASAIMTENYNAIPIIDKSLSQEYIKKEKLFVQSKPNDDMIDKEILKGKDNIVIDNRVYYVSKNRYETELYQLFRYHLSYYLNYVPAGIKYKEKLEKIIDDKTYATKRDKKFEIKKILYQMSNTELAHTYIELLKKKHLIQGGDAPSVETNILKHIVAPKSEEKTVQIIPEDFNVMDRRGKSNLRDTINTPENKEYDFTKKVPQNISRNFIKNEPPAPPVTYFPPDEKKWINILPETKTIDYPSFKIKNIRELCYNNNSKETCTTNQYCDWRKSKNTCVLSVNKDLLIDFINKVAEEFIQNELKAHEILRKGEYFVSDIVNYNVFTERPGERIIMSSNTNINKILGEIFGKSNIPKIGKRRNKFDILHNYEQLNQENPMRDMNNWYIQNIIENNNTIFRAFSNAYYWLMHPYNDVNMRNLGYYSNLQTTLSNVYKSQVIDWLLNKEHENEIQKLSPYLKYKISSFITKMGTDVITFTNGIIELYILSKLYDCIVYINDENYDIIFVIHPKDGIVYDSNKNNKIFDTSHYQNFKKMINLRFWFVSKNIIPDKIEVMYLKK